jgi:hypothetical protein
MNGGGPGPLGAGALDTGALGEPKGPVAEAPGALARVAKAGQSPLFI